MNSEKIISNGKEFLKISLERINQKDSHFFISKIKSYDLLNLYTVQPAKYDIKKNASLANSFKDEEDYYKNLVSLDKEKISEKEFQREFNKNRVNKITNYLEQEDYALFPNTIIITCDLINDLENYDLELNTDIDRISNLNDLPEHLSFLKETDEQVTLYVPYTNDSLLVIDGQHRLRGLEQTDTDFQKNYDVLVAFVVGYDRSVIAQLFYTINYEHKSVNKSLLYHLTGEFSTELDELTFMHHSVKVLNELDRSPFNGKVKMLGVNPKNATPEEKENLTISQAFLIDYLKRTISKNSFKSYRQPIFLYYFEKEDLQIEIIRFLIKYFNAVKDLLSDDWNSPKTNVLTKGIGIGALIRLLHLFFVELFINEWKLNPDKIKDITREEIKNLLSGLEKVNFSKDGEYGGGASGGTITKLSKEMVEKIDYFGDKRYDEYLSEFKNKKVPIFSSWLKENIKS